MPARNGKLRHSEDIETITNRLVICSFFPNKSYCFFSERQENEKLLAQEVARRRHLETKLESGKA